jgi:hypothetical protein
LGHFGGIVSDSVEGWGAGSLGYFLGGQMEIITVISWQWLHDDASRINIQKFGHKLVHYLMRVGQIKKSRVDFFVHYNYHEFGVVVGSLSFFRDFFYHILKGGNMRFGELGLSLGQTKTLQI